MDAQLIGIIAMLVFLALLLLFFLIRRTIIATIAGFSWQRNVSLQHFVWVKESSYSGFPDGSVNQRSEEESYLDYQLIRYDNRTTTDTDGNITIISEPVYEWITKYRTKYTYEIQRWCKSRELHAEGKKRSNVHWPLYTLDKTTRERTEKTRETYRVHFQTPKGKQYHRELTREAWDALDERATYRLRLTLYGTITEIKSEPEQAMVMPEQESTQ